jgi:hypothetical protein
MEKVVELWDGSPGFGESGKYKNHPLIGLYYQFKNPDKEPVNENDLTFAGDDLYKSNSFENVCSYSLEFKGEDEMDREAWADPVRAKALKNLSYPGYSWYISVVGEFKDPIIRPDGTWVVPTNVLDYFSKKDPSQCIEVNSKNIYGYGIKPLKKIFYEIPNDEIEWFALNVLPEAYQSYSIEGYHLPSNQIQILEEWNKHDKDEELFHDVLEKVHYLFYMFPEEHRHFAFY